MAEGETIWVRIKPYNEKKGHRIRRYSVMGVRFEEEMGWYKVPKTVAVQDGRLFNFETYLKQVRVDPDNEDSPLAFDVMTENEARKLDASEKRAAELRARAVDARAIKPVDMTPVKFDDGPAPPDAVEAEAEESKEERFARLQAESEAEAEAEDDDAPPVAVAPAAKRPRGRPRKSETPHAV